MEESNEELRVIPELYFLIAKFLSGGPLKETAKTLLKELESVEVLPRRLDWLGGEHAQSYEELASQYTELPWYRLATVCERALRLAPGALELGAPGTPPRLAARLSLLSETLVRPKPKYASHKPDHTLVRRLVGRELGSGRAGAAGAGMFPARMLAGLRLQRRTLGHLSAVYCLVFDCTGRYVVTGADDLLVKVWSAVDGRLVGTLRGAGAEITDVCVSGDGALVAAGSVERTVRVWCLRSAAPLAVLHAHQGTITSVHWAPPAARDLRWLASTSTDGSVAFWTCSRDGQFLSQPVQYVERMRPGACHMICAAWSAGGAFLAAGSADHHVRVYRVERASAPRRVLEVAAHTDAVDSLAWAHRGLRFVSGSKDGSAALWTLHATQWRHQLLRCAPLAPAAPAAPAAPDEEREPAKRLKVTMVCWDCSDAYVLTAVSDNSIRVWCSRSGRQTRALVGHRDEAYVLEPHPSLAAVLLSAGHDGQLFVWHAAEPQPLAAFHNHIAGQGDGAIFDAKWGGPASIAATDSHGHLLLLGLGQGHRLLQHLPTELFFHTDYRPLVRDALGGALDEQTETPPHLMPPPFLVDVEGAPHEPHFQRLVPGRENLALSQLIPAADAARSRIDLMIEALAAERTPPGAGGGGGGGGGGAGGGGGVWRGEGVRHTAGSWQSGEPAPCCTRPMVPPLQPAHLQAIEDASEELNQMEHSWYRREMRRRPVMISTAPEAQRRRPGRRPARPRAAPPPPVRRRPQPQPEPADMELELELEAEGASASEEEADTSDSSVRLSGSERSERSEHSERSGRSGRPRARARPRHQRAPRPPRPPRAPRRRSSDSDTSVSYSDTKTEDNSSMSSQYSDWEAGAALAPPARARRRPAPAHRYSPSTVSSKRGERSTAGAAAGAPAGTVGGAGAGTELPEAYRPGEWLCAVSPRKAPYHPQMGDHCLYFRLGHQRYFEAVAEKDLYKVNPRDKPWERTHVYECEIVKVVGIKYVIKPPRVVCLRLACSLAGPPGGPGGGPSSGSRTFTVRYHDMPDVIDFLVLRQQYDTATQRRWGPGDRFRCMIDDSWWTGVVLERTEPAAGSSSAGAGDSAEWAAAAAAHFLSLRVRWDNGEVERLSPWDLEPIDPERLPAEPGGAVAVLPHELEAVLYRAEPAEWPPRGDRAAACRAIAHHISQVMSLSVAEPFVAPVDLQLYPAYALVVPYPIDLATIKARFENLFYRRAAAAQFDVRYLASNAERFNEPHSPIVRQARLVTDLLLYIISHWREVDVVGKYHELAAAYHSSDDEPLANALHDKLSNSRSARRAGRAGRAGQARGEQWREACAAILRDLTASADAEPFRRPVSPHQAPDYHLVVSRPLDLGTVSRRLAAGEYGAPDQFAADVRTVFANSRLYNTNKRSRIYSMTVRLSALFESLWASEPAVAARAPRESRARPARAARQPRVSRAKRATRAKATATAAHAETLNGRLGGGYAGADGVSGSSDSETLAATSRRVHASAGAPAAPAASGTGTGTGAGRHRADSWDSDAPLNAHRKGKGVGKKSKSQSEPAAGTSRAPAHETYVCERNGADGLQSGSGSGSEWSGASHIQVVEEELAEEDVQLTYDEGTPPHSHAQRSRKRRRMRSSDSSSQRRARSRRRPGARPAHGGDSADSADSACSAYSDVSARARALRTRKRARRKHRASPPKPKRTRERFTEGSSSSSASGSSWSGPARGEAARYESDRSYRPRYSTDDDAPLHLYRQRQEAGSSEPGPSGSRRHHGHARGGGSGGGGGVSLRERRSPRRYNEDSEEDSIAAISKRLPHHHRHHAHQQSLAHRRHRHASRNVAAAVSAAAAAHTNDHNYFNGHAHAHGHGHAHAAAHAHNGMSREAEGSGSSGAAPVSISSRGRVRKLTAKARGLLRD